MITLRAVGQLLKEDKLPIDLCGHRTSRLADIKERFIYQYDHLLDGEAGKMDGQWNKHGDSKHKVTDAQMREHFQRQLDFKFEENGLGLGSDWRYYCFGCGENLGLVYNGDRLTLRNYYDHKARDIVNHPLDYRCPFEILKPFKDKITISSTMVFSNFFRSIPDTPDEEEYSDEWSINCLAGRERVMHHKAKQNVAYGQMGNMSVGIFVNKKKDSIIIGDPYTAEDDRKVLYKHKLVGRLCLDVWRWEASDMNTVGEEVGKLEKEGREVIKIKVPHGVWNVEQRFHLERDEGGRMSVFARLKLA